MGGDTHPCYIEFGQLHYSAPFISLKEWKNKKLLFFALAQKQFQDDKHVDLTLNFHFFFLKNRSTVTAGGGGGG